jgi:hypothetical protein
MTITNKKPTVQTQEQSNDIDESEDDDSENEL